MQAEQNRKVLVIDATYQPVSIVSWRRALTKLFAGRERAKTDRNFQAPEVVVYSKDGTVVGLDGTRLPAVIRLGSIIPTWKRRIRFCRKNVIVGRDRCVCQYCGKRFMTEDLTIDHIVPRAQGGQTRWENVVAACIPCNQAKADRTPEQAKMKLLSKPGKPHSLLDVIVKMDIKNIPTEWADYWDSTLER